MIFPTLLVFVAFFASSSWLCGGTRSARSLRTTLDGASKVQAFRGRCEVDGGNPTHDSQFWGKTSAKSLA